MNLQQISKAILGFIYNNFQQIAFYSICWSIGIFLFYKIDIIHLDNISKINEIKPLTLAFMFIALVLILLPFFKKIKIGEIEIEREISSIKKELTDFRQTLAIISTSINTISNSTQITINNQIPDTNELKQETQKLTNKSINFQSPVNTEEIKHELILDDEDVVLSLARTRIRIEFLLRKILDKRIETIDENKNRIKFLGLNTLVKEFLKSYPDYGYLEQSFTYIINLANAAIHAQKIGMEQASEAVELGARIIAILKPISNQQEN